MHAWTLATTLQAYINEQLKHLYDVKREANGTYL
jgi:hypothetical protein